MKKVILFLSLLLCLSAQPNLESSLRDFIFTKYKQVWLDNNIEILNIDLKSMVKTDLTNTTLESIRLDSRAVLRKHNSIYAVLKKQNGSILVPFDYVVKAKIDVVKSKRLIIRNENLDSSNTYVERIFLENFKSKPLSLNALNNASAKTLIAQDSIIFQDKAQNKILVKKGEKVLVYYDVKNIRIEYFLIALQNGALNEVISAKHTESNKIVKIKVVEKGKAMLF